MLRSNSENTQPISSGGLGEALRRSASSFAAARSSYAESAALITAANATVQDPEVVGTFWKTTSMRLRGAKLELQQMGESTEGMVDSAAKLRGEIKALSGVDIMKSAGTFKSPYAIIEELQAVWTSLPDISQASLIEIISGAESLPDNMVTYYSKTA